MFSISRNFFLILLFLSFYILIFRRCHRSDSCPTICRLVPTEEIRSVSSPKSINPVITSELVGVATERTAVSTSERQRIGSQSSHNASSTGGAAMERGSAGDLAVRKKPRHYLSGTFYVDSLLSVSSYPWWQLLCKLDGDNDALGIECLIFTNNWQWENASQVGTESGCETNWYFL